MIAVDDSTLVTSPQPLTPALLLSKLNQLADSDPRPPTFRFDLTSTAAVSSDESSNASDVVLLTEDDDDDDEDDEEGWTVNSGDTVVQTPLQSPQAKRRQLTLTTVPKESPRSPRDVVQDVTAHILVTLHRTLDAIRSDLRRTLRAPEILTSALAALPSAAAAFVPTRLTQLVRHDLARDLQLQFERTRNVIIAGVHDDVERVFAEEQTLRDDMNDVEAQWLALQSWAEDYVTRRVQLVVDTVRLYATETIPRYVDAALVQAGDTSNALLRPVYNGVRLGVVPVVNAIVIAVIRAVLSRTEWITSAVQTRVKREMHGLQRRFAATATSM